MANEYEFDFENNPRFNTVLDLSNRTFDPENFVSGRGATEDQLKYMWDVYEEIHEVVQAEECDDDPYSLLVQRVTELEERQKVCCDNPQSGIIAAYNNRIDGLEARQTACCNNEGATITAVFNQIQSRLTQLESKMEGHCNSTMVGNETPLTNAQSAAVGGFSLNWNAANNTGQVVYTKNNAGDAASYFFLTEMNNGLYYAKGKTVAAGKGILSLNTATGAVSYTPDAYNENRGRRSLVVGVVDTGGNQMLGVVNLPTSLWT